MTVAPHFATRDDHRLRALVVAGTVALGQRVPRRHRHLALAGAALAAAVRVVDWFIATPRTVGRMPFQRDRTGLAVLAQAVSSFDTRRWWRGSRCGSCALRPSADAAARRCLRAPAASPRCRPSARSARPCRGSISMQWMIEPTGMLRIGSVLPALIGASAPDNTVAPTSRPRGDDEAALAVGVAQQRDVRRAVRVVLDALDLRRDAVLAHEVDHAVVVLVTTAPCGAS